MRTHAALAALAACTLAGSALGGVRFDLLVFENADGVGTGNLDIWVDVVDNGSTIDFVWHNDSTASATVTSIYSEISNASGTLTNALIMNDASVQYSSGATPPNPPGSISFFGGAWAGNHFSADPDVPQPMVKAINPGESLTVRFDLGSASFQDIIDALNGGPAAFRLAAHVQEVGPGGESSVWVVTPTPGTAGLMALGGLVAMRRRR